MQKITTYKMTQTIDLQIYKNNKVFLFTFHCFFLFFSLMEKYFVQRYIVPALPEKEKAKHRDKSAI